MALKILILSDAWHPQVNGVVRTYEHLGDALKALGHHVRVIGPCDFPATFPMPLYAEIKLAILPDLYLSRLINDYSPDIIHIATEGPIGRAARSWCLRHHKPFTTCYHTHFPDYVAKRFSFLGNHAANWIKRRVWDYLRWFHRPATGIYTATQSLEDTLREHGFSGKLYRLSRGVEGDIFNPRPRTNGFQIPNLKKPIALYVGRIAPEKNISAFLDMEWPGSKIVVGTGPQYEILRSQYPSVIFTGVQTGHTLADIYRMADVFVFPSLTDTFGMVLIEALACGVPIAAYNVAGPKDIVTKAAFGCLENDLSVAAHTALQNGDRAACATYVASTYDWSVVAEQFLADENRTITLASKPKQTDKDHASLYMTG